MALKFDSAIAHELLVEWKDTTICPNKLIEMYYQLLSSLLTKPKFQNYPDHVKEDMQSEAIYQFLKYSHNYKPEKIKSKNGAFTFLVFNAENSFKKILKGYYKQKNLEDLMANTQDMVGGWEEYVTRLNELEEEDELDTEES